MTEKTRVCQAQDARHRLLFPRTQMRASRVTYVSYIWSRAEWCGICVRAMREVWIEVSLGRVVVTLDMVMWGWISSTVLEGHAVEYLYFLNTLGTCIYGNLQTAENTATVNKTICLPRRWNWVLGVCASTLLFIFSKVSFKGVCWILVYIQYTDLFVNEL